MYYLKHNAGSNPVEHTSMKIGNCFINKKKTKIIQIVEVRGKTYTADVYRENFNYATFSYYNKWQINKYFDPIDDKIIDKTKKIINLNLNIIKTKLLSFSKPKGYTRFHYYINNDYSIVGIDNNYKFYTITRSGIDVFFIATYVNNLNIRLYKRDYVKIMKLVNKLEKNLAKIWKEATT